MNSVNSGLLHAIMAAACQPPPMGILPLRAVLVIPLVLIRGIHNPIMPLWLHELLLLACHGCREEAHSPSFTNTYMDIAYIPFHIYLWHAVPRQTPWTKTDQCTHSVCVYAYTIYITNPCTTS